MGVAQELRQARIYCCFVLALVRDDALFHNAVRAEDQVDRLLPSGIVEPIRDGPQLVQIVLEQSMLLAEAYGAQHYARIYSIGNLIATAGVAGGPLVLGLLHDVSGYRVAYLGAMAASMLAALVMAAAGDHHPAPPRPTPLPAGS